MFQHFVLRRDTVWLVYAPVLRQTAPPRQSGSIAMISRSLEADISDADVASSAKPLQRLQHL